MWSDQGGRAGRLSPTARVEPFDWGPGRRHVRVDPAAARVPEAAAPEASAPAPRPSTAEIERDAFTKGYAEGERAGAQAAAVRGEAMLRRLSGTLEELAGLRAEMIQKTERQLVQLALAIAARILQREVSLDRELLVAMARVALDRLGETATATIRLNPADFALIGIDRLAPEHSAVRIVADPLVSAGGCLVQSDFGLMDVGVEAQLAEVARALLGDAAAPALDSAEQRLEGGPIG